MMKSGHDELRTVDALVIGAGVSGLYQLLRLRDLGLRVDVLEAGSDVGGTWYWNRYPGARFDSESYTYGYSFSDPLLDEWEWTEHFSPQPETLRYLRHVADRFALRPHIRFDQRVTSATWDDEARRWTVATEDGSTWATRWLVTAIGALSVPTLPVIEGRDDFAGPAFHTARWPEDGVDLTGLRVGVIGTGATAVQLIPEVPRPPRRSRSSNAPPTGARPSTTGRSTPRRKPRSGRTSATCSAAVGRPSAGSSTTRSG
jgi:cation diffusion facilitator CzcD-associated flavoprotein CzcO